MAERERNDLKSNLEVDLVDRQTMATVERLKAGAETRSRGTQRPKKLRFMTVLCGIFKNEERDCMKLAVVQRNSLTGKLVCNVMETGMEVRAGLATVGDEAGQPEVSSCTNSLVEAIVREY